MAEKIFKTAIAIPCAIVLCVTWLISYLDCEVKLIVEDMLGSLADWIAF